MTLECERYFIFFFLAEESVGLFFGGDSGGGIRCGVLHYD